MAQLPKIYIIQASDAPRHSATLGGILTTLKDEHRIGDFQAVQIAGGLKTLDEVADGDLILTLLTKDLESEKIQLEKILVVLKGKNPDLKIAEIIVDQVPYENEYLTFPEDLRPIRGREDMDAVWLGIEQSLKDMFPVQVVDDDSDPGLWSKYGKYVIAVVALLILFWLVPKLFTGRGPQAEFSYKVLDPISGQLLSDTSECYLPCLVTFNNQSKDFDQVNWDFGDTIMTDQNDPDYLFFEPGKHKVVLTAIRNKKENNIEKTILIKAPPLANFKVINDGCEAPCKVGFQNISKNSEQYRWEFGDNSERSDEENPEKSYQNPGEYKVKLTASNSDGVKSDTVATVNILEDDSPFAQFEIRHNGPRGKVPQTVTFKNLSKNASQYEWTFGPGANPQTSNAESPTVTYNAFGRYPVGLKAIRGAESGTEVKQVAIYKYVIGQYEINPAIEAQILANPQYKKHLESIRNEQ